LTRHPQSTRQSIIEQMDKQQVKAPHALRAAWREKDGRTSARQAAGAKAEARFGSVASP
jgi:hypothetical protein